MPRITNAPGARIATGTYTGDGSTSHAITGIGFQPKYVKIFVVVAAEAATMIFETVENLTASYAVSHITVANNEHYASKDSIISLDVDGFTVDDDGTDAHPNKNTQVYAYLCLG